MYYMCTYTMYCAGVLKVPRHQPLDALKPTRCTKACQFS